MEHEEQAIQDLPFDPPLPVAEAEPHEWVRPRFIGAFTISVGLLAIGISLMTAGFLVPLGFAISLSSVLALLVIYWKNLKEIAKFLRRDDGNSMSRVEVIAVAGLLYCLPIIAVLVYLRATILASQQSVAIKADVAATVSPADRQSLRVLKNDELVSLVAKLTKELRALEVTYSNEDERIMIQPVIGDPPNKAEMQKLWSNTAVQQNELRARLNFEWQTKYRSRSRAAYEELCKRLGIIPDNFSTSATSMNQQAADALLQTGMLAGAYPISALADYLDSLSNQLD